MKIVIETGKPTQFEVSKTDDNETNFNELIKLFGVAYRLGLRDPEDAKTLFSHVVEFIELKQKQNVHK